MDCLTNPFSLRNRKKSSVTAAVVAACSLLAQGTPSAHAFSAPNGYQNGAPFSNGTFFPTDGTFQATIRGKNLSGVAVFSTSASGSSDAPATGIFSVTFGGFTYAGNVNAAIDTAEGTIAATLEASVERLGQGTLVTTIAIEQTILQNSTTTTESSTTGTTVTVDTTETVLETEYTATSDYNDVLYCSGSFEADLFPTYPQQAFVGEGEMTFQEVDLTFSETDSSALTIPTLTSTKVDIKVDGVRTSDTASSFIPQTVDIPFVVTTYQVETTTIGN